MCRPQSAYRSEWRSPHMTAETRRTRECRPRSLSTHGGGDEADTCVCRPQTRVAIPAHKDGAEADTGVCRSQKRAALSAHKDGDEAFTGVCSLQIRAALSAHDGGDEADMCVRHPQNAHRSPHMTAETRRSHVCAARRSAQRSPHMVTETRRTRVCAGRRALTALSI